MTEQKNQILILEGADGTGKTTIGKKLAEDYGYAYIHCTYNKSLIGHMTGYFMGVLSSAVHISKRQPVVIDRWRMSELVYGEVFRSGSENSYATGPLFDMADEAGATYLFCHPGLHNREKYLAAFNKLRTEREEMYTKMSGVYDSYAEHILSFQNKRRSTLLYDRFERSLDDLIDEIICGF